MNSEIISKAAEIIAGNCNQSGYCALAQLDLDGSPTAATITPAKADGIREIFFGSGLESNWAKRATACPKASVCFNSPTYNVTLTGTIEIITDPAVKREMWYDGLEHHFSGHDDPAYCVLRFVTARYNLFVDWQSERGEF